MSIENRLRIRLESINKNIERYKKNAIEEIEKEELSTATIDLAIMRDLKEQQLLIKQMLDIKEEEW